MEHVIASYLRQVWDKNDWQYEGQHGFRPGYSCESQVITSRYARTLRIDVIIVDFSKAFDLVPHGRLLTKIANSSVDSRVVVWIREFLLGRTQRVRMGGQLSAEVRVTSGVPQGSVLGPLILLYDLVWKSFHRLTIQYLIEQTARWITISCQLRKRARGTYESNYWVLILQRSAPTTATNHIQQCSHPTTRRPTTATNRIQQNQNNTPNAVKGSLFSWRWA